MTEVNVNLFFYLAITNDNKPQIANPAGRAN